MKHKGGVYRKTPYVAYETARLRERAINLSCCQEAMKQQSRKHNIIYSTLYITQGKSLVYTVIDEDTVSTVELQHYQSQYV